MISGGFELIKELIHLALRVVGVGLPLVVLAVVIWFAWRILRNLLTGRSSNAERGLAWFRESWLGRLMNRIQVQMVIVFALSALAYVVVVNGSNAVFGRVITNASMDYSNSMTVINSDAQSLATEIQDPAQRPTGTNGRPMSVQATLNNQAGAYGERVYVINPAGRVLFSSSNADETQFNMQRLIAQVSDSTASNYTNNPDYTPTGSIVRMYPTTLNGTNGYVVVQGIATPNLVYTQTNNPLSNALGLVAFLLTFYLLTRRKIWYLQELSRGLHAIAGGDLKYRVRQLGSDELATVAMDINHTAASLQRQIESERLAEKTKSELITNVSHDLRTPLTLITGYLRLLKDRKYANDSEYDEYVSIANDKCDKLSTLIDSLFEYTKLSNHGVQLEYHDVSLAELLQQLVEEMVTVAEQETVSLRAEYGTERLPVRVDPRQLSRVFENLLTNGIQHSLKPGEVSVRLYREDDLAVCEIANQTDGPLEGDVTRLFERFYRGNQARTSTSGGSGLGLAIAKSIVDLHGGEIGCRVDGSTIVFAVKLPLRAASNGTTSSASVV